MKLSNQALGALMLTLQKSLMLQEDIVPDLKSFEFELDGNGELLVKNPPKIDLSKFMETVELTDEEDVQQKLEAFDED